MRKFISTIQVTRNEFVDRALTLSDLRDAAEMWRLWFRIAAAESPLLEGAAGGALCRLEAVVFGFPRRDADTTLAMMRNALAEVPGSQTATLIDPDTIVVATADRTAQKSCNIEAWRRLLQLDAARSWSLTLRIVVTSFSAGGKLQSCNALFFGGRAISTGDAIFELKGAWHASEGSKGARIGRMTAVDEPKLLAAFDAFVALRKQLSERAGLQLPGISPQLDLATPSPRAASEIARRLHGLYGRSAAIAREALVIAPPDPHSCAAVLSYDSYEGARANELFPLMRVSRGVDRYLWLFYDLSESRGLPSFLARLGIPAICAMAALVPLALGLSDARFRVALAIIGAISLLIVLRVLWTKARRIYRYRKHMNEGLRKAYEKQFEFEFVDLAAGHPMANDPCLLKYSAEWIAAGARHAFDFRLVLPQVKSVARRFVFPGDPAIQLTLSFMEGSGKIRHFPTTPIVILATYFTDGTRQSTINSGGGYRKYRMGKSITRICIDEHDPARLLEVHRKVLARLRAQGLNPEVTRPEPSMELERKHHEEAAEFYRNRIIYTWSDALHEAFDIPRREFLKY